MDLEKEYIQLLKKCKNLIENNDFKAFYEREHETLLVRGLFTEFFMKECGINLFDYLDELPEALFSWATIEDVVIPLKYDEIPAHCFISSNIKNITLPETIDELHESAFNVCGNLSEIKIPDNVTKIHRNCFSYCSNLRIVKLPENLQFLHDNVFASCVSLEKIKIPENTISVGSTCFRGCTNLKEVEIPSIVSIAPDAFKGCSDNLIIRRSNLEELTLRYYRSALGYK